MAEDQEPYQTLLKFFVYIEDIILSGLALLEVVLGGLKARKYYDIQKQEPVI